MAKFSKWHYQVIARILIDAKYKQVGEGEGFAICRPEIVQAMAHDFADTFEADNHAFNREHFVAVVKEERPVNSPPPRT